MTKEEARSSVMGAISMALKDPILQQGFEIICKNLAEFEKENAELKNERNAFKIYSDGAELDAINLNEQLAKAKVALRKVVDYLGQFCSDYPDCVIEAEKILKEE